MDLYNNVHAVCPYAHLAWQNLQCLNTRTHISTKFFHTYHAYRHHWWANIVQTWHDNVLMKSTVWYCVTLTLIQGHRGVRNQRRLCQSFYTVLINLDGIWCAVVICWSRWWTSRKRYFFELIFKGKFYPTWMISYLKKMKKKKREKEEKKMKERKDFVFGLSSWLGEMTDTFKLYSLVPVCMNLTSI